MKKTRSIIVLVIIMFCYLFSKAQDIEKKVNVSGNIKSTHHYCNDVINTRIKAKIEKPRPFPHKKLYVKQGDQNDFIKPVIMEFQSDSAGNFSILLPHGKYFIVGENKKDKSCYDNILKMYGKGTRTCSPIDTNCLKKWYQTPDAVIVVGNESVKNITITYDYPCDCDVPCARSTVRRR
jgi:hypothetical protein